MTGKVAYLRTGAAERAGILDETLVMACARGDRAALAELFDRHHRAVYRFLSRICGADGPDLDDLVQIVFITLLDAADGFRGRSAVRSWILGIAANVAHRHFRSEARRRRTADALAEIPVTGPRQPDAEVETAGQLRKLAAALPSLPYDLRLAFVMCDVEGIPGVDAARSLGIPSGTLWRRLHEARKTLAAAVERKSK